MRFFERPHEILVRARDERVHQLDDGDLRAERVVHRRHLEPDDAAADDQQALRALPAARARRWNR